MIVQVTIKNAAGLPPSLSNFVFCQYMFWGDAEVPTVVPPVEQAVNSCQTNSSCYDYNSNSESFHDSCSNLNDSLGECGLSVGGTGGGRYDHLPKVLKKQPIRVDDIQKNSYKTS